MTAPTSPPAPINQLQPTGPRTGRSAGLVFALTLLVAFIALNIAVSLLERPLLQILRYHPDATMAQLNVLQPGQSYDVIFMGTSRAQFGFDPAAFSEEAARISGAPVSSVNLGIPGTRLDVARLVLKNRILTGHKPKLIVYGISEFELWDPPDIDYIKDVTKLSYVSLAMSPDEVSRYGGDTPLEQLAFVADATVPLLRYRSMIRDALDIRFNAENFYHAYYVSGPKQRTLREDGLWVFPPDWPQPTQATERVEAFRAVQRNTLAGLRATGERRRQLQDFADLARENDVGLLVLNMPVSENYLGLWPSQNKIDEYMRYAGQLTQQMRVPYVDLYRDGRALAAGAFWDDHHMSNGGAAAFSRCIAPAVLGVLNTGQAPQAAPSLSACR